MPLSIQNKIEEKIGEIYFNSSKIWREPELTYAFQELSDFAISEYKKELVKKIKILPISVKNGHKDYNENGITSFVKLESVLSLIITKDE